MTKIKIIPHTHWDKEWYFTASKSLIYSLRDFDEVLDVLQRHPDFRCFHLDGQLSILEEYLELHTARQSQVQTLVQEGRLIIGPWFTQPDTLVISGESLLKNLEIGIALSKKYGKHQSIGYLPDSFGMSAQMPQIYKYFSLEYAFFRRGIAKHLVDNREFIWKSLDGAEIFTHNLHHYGNMAYPPNEPHALKEYYQDMVDKLSPTSLTDTVILYNGEDQKPIRRNLPDLVKKGRESTNFDIKIDTLENALRELEEEYHSSNLFLPVYQGEFTFGQYSRTHKSIFSTRVDLKQLNNYLENYISNIVEPLSTVAYALGLPYEGELIDKIWKLMLLNSAHDSIGNCNSDWTNDDIESRYILAKSLSEELVDFKLREIGETIQSDWLTQFQVFNLLPYNRSGQIELTLYSPCKTIVIKDDSNNDIMFHIEAVEDVTDTYLKKSLKEIGVDNDTSDCRWSEHVQRLFRITVTIFAENIPALGYQTFHLEECTESEAITTPILTDYIENSRYKVEFVEGNISIFDKNNNFTYSDVIAILDDGDEGDSYDYSEPIDNRVISAYFNNYTIEEDSLSCTLILSGTMTLPINLKNRLSMNETLNQSVIVAVTLNKVMDDAIRVHVSTTNIADEHRLRVVFNTHKANPYSYSDIQFGTYKRPTYLEQVEVWEKEHWDEKPRTIEPMQSYVTNGFSKGNLQVIVENGIREYQFIGEDYSQMALTMYRSVPYLGKADLQDRPGRESGTKVPTEGTRHMGAIISATYHLRVLQDGDTEYQCAQAAKEILTPLLAYQASPYKNNTDEFVFSTPEQQFLYSAASLLTANSELVLSTISKCRYSNLLKVRLFNPSMNEKVAVDVNDWNSLVLKYEGTINGLEEVETADSKIVFHPCQFKTLVFRSM